MTALVVHGPGLRSWQDVPDAANQEPVPVPKEGLARV
jgi:hypothetical protein